MADRSIAFIPKQKQIEATLGLILLHLCPFPSAILPSRGYGTTCIGLYHSSRTTFNLCADEIEEGRYIRILLLFCFVMWNFKGELRFDKISTAEHGFLQRQFSVCSSSLVSCSANWTGAELVKQIPMQTSHPIHINVSQTDRVEIQTIMMMMVKGKMKVFIYSAINGLLGWERVVIWPGENHKEVCRPVSGHWSNWLDLWMEETWRTQW